MKLRIIHASTLCLALGLSLINQGPVFAANKVRCFVEKDKQIFEIQENWKMGYGNIDRISADLALIEFDDNGNLLDDDQIVRVEKHIQNRSAWNANGLVVLAFIHGWQHDASWDPKGHTGDKHIMQFQDILMSLAARETERSAGARNVVGVYLSWPGLRFEGWRKLCTYLPYGELCTFGNRYDAATTIGSNQAISEALQRITSKTKDKPQSPVIFIGHSMGSLILQKAFSSILQQIDNSSMQAGSLPFPDLIVLLNSAANSLLTMDVLDRIEKYKAKLTTNKVNTPTGSYRRPFFISATSEGDTDTRDIFSFYRSWFDSYPDQDSKRDLPFDPKKYWKTTDGNNPDLLTHTLNKDKALANCPPLGPRPKARMFDFGQSWHCLRSPNNIEGDSLIEISIDLPQPGKNARECLHERYRFGRLANSKNLTPFWAVKVPSDLMADHGDIFNARARLLVMAFVQISGAIMSLSSDEQQTFEFETLECPERATPSTPLNCF